MKILLFECRRALSERTFRISLALSTFLVLWDCYLFWFDFGRKGNKILIQAWIGTNYQFAFNSLFYVILPILACLPFGGSYFWDQKNGYDKNICVKTSRIRYLYAKMVAVFFVGFLAVVIPLLLSLFLSAGLYPNWPEETLEHLAVGLQERQILFGLYDRNPACYAIAYTVIDGLIGGLMGLVAISVSGFCNTMFSAIMSPFLIYIVTGVLLQGIGGDPDEQLSLMEMANPLQNYAFSALRLAAVYIVVFVIAITVSYLRARREDIR